MSVQMPQQKYRPSLKCRKQMGCPKRGLLEFGIMNQNDDDLALVKRALPGDESAANTIYSMGPQLVVHLTKKGPPHGSVSEDAAADFLGDCFGTRERSARATTNRLLEVFQGNSPHIAW